VTGSQRIARLLALLLPAALLAGAWGFQLIGGLVPCEMCHWQRWPHYAAVVFAALSFVVGGPRTRLTLVAGAAALIAVSGVIGVLHLGVEQHWWQGFTACTSTIGAENMTPDEMLQAMLRAPVVRCDAAQWSWLGVSMAGWNAILSLGGAGVIAWLLRRRVR
jgi:disulfide bond formation protein DsbB